MALGRAQTTERRRRHNGEGSVLGGIVVQRSTQQLHDGCCFPSGSAQGGRSSDPQPVIPVLQLPFENIERRLRLDPNVTVHSLRVTALTTARERGSDIIDLQDFAGHADPRTTLTYIRTRDRLSKSWAAVGKVRPCGRLPAGPAGTGRWVGTPSGSGRAGLSGGG